MKSLLKKLAVALFVFGQILAQSIPSYAVAITVTAANVSLVDANSTCILSNQIASTVITVGQSVYLLDAGTWGLAQGDGTAVEAGSNNVGISLSTVAAAGQRLTIATRGCQVGFGAVLTAGLFYTVCDTAGAICPSADNGSTDKATLLGQAISTSTLLLMGTYNAGAVI